ncbi:MAG: hypothetical protein AVDCRST_MAG38-226 [uncultured Solirubrobacteraceae bacterium]|uniref:Uncharacterized protein n=1 Tax=uncultured Solirubrobacteraceae bacterium TaxID=1162706 RepID=A0A6J4R479_9ACTN|nr:MAG: hypothetical protein AVDCRST_MAG38-226 [uncultured Solirubrobacteraceae bacterium]
MSSTPSPCAAAEEVRGRALAGGRTARPITRDVGRNPPSPRRVEATSGGGLESHVSVTVGLV